MSKLINNEDQLDQAYVTLSRLPRTDLWAQERGEFTRAIQEYENENPWNEGDEGDD